MILTNFYLNNGQRSAWPFWFCMAWLAGAELLVVGCSFWGAREQWLGVLLLCCASIAASVVLLRKDRPCYTPTIVLLIAVVTRALPLFAQPILDDDYFRFLWDGYQLSRLQSPYALAPAAWFDDGSLSQSWQNVLSQINHPDIKTIYGPVLQGVFAFAVRLDQLFAELGGGQHAIGLKLIYSIADCTLIALLLRYGVRPRLVLLYVVNALVLKEVHFSLHPDGLIAMMLALAVMCAAHGQSAKSAMSFAVVVAMKVPLAVLAVVFLRLPLKRSAQWCGQGALMLGALYLPFIFWNQGVGLDGLAAFAQHWRVNSLGFVVFEWLAPVWAPELARIIFAALVVCAACACAAIQLRPALCKRWPTATISQALCWLYGTILLFAPTVNAWYWVALLPVSLLCVSGERGMATVKVVYSVSFLLFLSNINGALLQSFDVPNHYARHEVHEWASGLQRCGIVVALIVSAFASRVRLTAGSGGIS